METAMQKFIDRRAEAPQGGAYLNRSELRALTGTPIRARQILWLAKQGWPHVVDLHGRVLVARAFHDKQMGISEHKPSRLPSARTSTPLNLGAV